MLAAIKRDISERFLTFESINGAFVFIPWGAGFIYYGVYAPQFGYTYGMVSLGICLIIWGLRKVLVNRVHQQVTFDQKVKECKIEKGMIPSASTGRRVNDGMGA